MSSFKGFGRHDGSDNTVNVTFVKEKEVLKISLEYGVSAHNFVQLKF